MKNWFDEALSYIILAAVILLLFIGAIWSAHAWGQEPAKAQTVYEEPAAVTAWKNHASGTYEALIAARDMGSLPGHVLAGDIIAVRPAGWPWGKKELDNKDFKVVKLSNLTRAQAETICGPEMAPNPTPGEPPIVVKDRRYRFALVEAGTTLDARNKVITDKKVARKVSAIDAENDQGADQQAAIAEIIK